MSFGLFHKISAWVLAAATAIWAYDVTPPVSQWDFSKIRLPEIQLAQIALPDLSGFKFGWPSSQAPRTADTHQGAADAAARVNMPVPTPKPAVAPRMARTETEIAAAPESEMPAPVVSAKGPLADRLMRDHARDRLGGVVDWTALREFYARRAYAPAWSGSAGAGAYAQLARETLMQAGAQGLDASDYFAGASAIAKGADERDPASDFELLLTDGLLRYAHDVRVGRVRTNPGDPDMAFAPQSFNAVPALAAALEHGDFAAFLADLPPRYTQYRLLVSALAKYRALGRKGTYPPRIPAEPALDLDGNDPRLVLLRQRLILEDANLSPVAPSYGGADGLRGAVIRFQERNGLPADGFVGPDTLDMLNSRPEDRLAQIAANMERWRWLPHEIDARAVMVQLPEAKIRYVEDGVVKFETRGIFGRPTNPSPAMGVKITAITVNPPWHAPESITVKELLPALREDPYLLRNQNMTLVNGPPGDPYGLSINWNAVSAAGFPYGIRQRPGADSALGRIKFEMPNNYIVYLHDTPDHWWFGQPVQALSHGCIRVDEPLPLASLVMSGDAQAERARLDAMVQTGQTRTLALSKPVPVYILYLTALAQQDGSVRFYPDLYRRDRELIAQLRAANSAGL